MHLKEVTDQLGLQEELKNKDIDRVVARRTALQELTEKEV